ncbi:MAG: hypothetical protein QXF41_01610 [Candidatus Micrarchaeaceae archaeon]
MQCRKYKLILPSLDMLIALQLMLIATLILFKAYYVPQEDMAAALSYQREFLNLSDLSQEFVTVIEKTRMNFSAAASFLASESSAYGIKISLLVQNTSSSVPHYCSYSLCRFITSDNITYLMVMSNENTNES